MQFYPADDGEHYLCSDDEDEDDGTGHFNPEHGYPYDEEDSRYFESEDPDGVNMHD